MGLFSWFKKNESIRHGAMIIAVFTILSKFLGLFRYSLIASFFGTGPIAESFYAAFRIPDFLYNAFVLGAFSTAFIPVFLDFYHKKKEETTLIRDLSAEATEESLASVNIAHQEQVSTATSLRGRLFQSGLLRLKAFTGTINSKKTSLHWDLTNALLNSLTVLLVIVVAITWFLTPMLVSRMVPGFDKERIDLTISFTRILLLSPILFSISNVFGSVLQALHRFTLFAIAPVLYNLGIICGIIFLYPIMGPKGLAFGVVLGAILHLLIQFVGAMVDGFEWRPIFSLQVHGALRVIKLILPRAFALSANQLNQLMNTFFASTVGVGSVAVFYNAYDIATLPVSLIAVSLAVASFPVLGDLYVKKKNKEFKKVLQNVTSHVFCILIPLTVFMILLRAHIVRLILGYGRYNWDATIRTLDAFGIFVWSLIFQSLIPVFARAFYARENTKTPLFIGIGSIALNIFLAFILTPLYGLNGLTLAFSLSSAVQCLVLLFALDIELSHFINKTMITNVLYYCICAVIGGAALYLSLYIIEPFFGTARVWALFLQAAGAFSIGSIMYIVLLLIFGDPIISKVLKHKKP